MNSAQQPTPVAVFDFDGTMIKGDSMVAFILYALRKGVVSPLRLPGMGVAALRVSRGRLSPALGKSRALSFMGSLEGAALDGFAQSFCREVLMPGIFPKALERLAWHRGQGHLCAVVSASPDTYMRHMQTLLEADAVIASITDPKGHVSINMRGDAKVTHLHAWLKDRQIQPDWANSWAYGNSVWDLPVLRLTGNPVMVNPSARMRREGKGLPLEFWDERQT